MIKETFKDYVYMTMVLAMALISSVLIWKTSESIVYGSVASATGSGGLKSESSKSLKVFEPKPLSKIESPLKISGRARGTWYFEASFPIKIVDEDFNVLGQGNANALSDWMTEAMVPFEALIDFDSRGVDSGFIILSEDDPSGMGNPKSVKIPVTFLKQNFSECKISGCSREICSDEDVASICIYKNEYACYENATCRRQENGKCGWTLTPGILQCINDSREINNY